MGIDVTDVYIDDVGAFSSSWQDCIGLLDTILHRLCDNGFTILKCEWAVQETDWLSYWLKPHDLKPWKKKIDAILHMGHPRTATDLCRFIGCINCYRDMWPSHSHVLGHLAACSGMKKNAILTWTSDMKDAFDKMFLLMTAHALSAYSDHNKRFDIDVFTDSSDYQMGV